MSDLMSIKIADIEPNPSNPRKYFDPEALQELAQSIKEVGILQPLVVVPITHREKYRLVCGERRWRAAQLAGQEFVPAIIRVLTPKQEAELMLVENLQRKDLDPIEEARAYHELLKDHSYTQEALGERLGVSQGHIANRLRLLRLPDEVKENISRKIISAGHAHALLKLEKAPAVMKKAAEAIAEEQVPVARAADKVKEIVAKEGRPLFADYNNKPEFKTDGCEKCEFRVMGNRWSYTDEQKPYCIKPSCWDKKQQDVRRDRELAVADRVQKMAKKGQGVVELDKLSYDQYVEFVDYNTKNMNLTECEGCEHKKHAKKSYKDELTEACFQPSCFKKKQLAATRERNKVARDAMQEELNQISVMAGLKAASLKRWEPGGEGSQVDTMFVIDRPTLIYIAGSILGSLGSLQDRPTLYRYIRGKYGCDNEVLKRGQWGMLNSEWDKFRQLLETLTDQQLLEVIFEWPAVALGLNGAPEWILQQGPGQAQEANTPIEKILDQFVNGPGPTSEEVEAEKERFNADLYKRFELEEEKPTECPHLRVEPDLCSSCAEVAAREHEPDPVHTLIGRVIKTHYNTGGVVTGVSGPKDDGFYTVNYRDPRDKRKRLSTINSITVSEGIVLCECVSLTVLDTDKSEQREPEELPPRRYLHENGRELFVSNGLGSEYGTFWRSEKGGLHRVKSPDMPMVATREEAQANLDAWAAKKGLQQVDGDDQCRQSA